MQVAWGGCLEVRGQRSEGGHVVTGVITHVTHRVIIVNWSSSIISDIKDG